MMSKISSSKSSIFTGILIILVVRQYHMFSTVFVGLLIFIIFLATNCVMILLTTRLNLQATTFNKIKIIFNDYSNSNSTLHSQDIVRRIQQSFECCGIQAATD